MENVVVVLVQVDFLSSKNSFSHLIRIVKQGVIVLAKLLAFIICDKLILEFGQDSLHLLIIELEILQIHGFLKSKHLDFLTISLHESHVIVILEIEVKTNGKAPKS